MTNAAAGKRALGESPKAATPAGRERTPAPTIFLTKLKTSLEIEAVPVPKSFWVATSVDPPLEEVADNEEEEEEVVVANAGLDDEE